ncbi:unnamed protein product [Pleuronectes platessa]|uniref:Uncharacterized protein n=1 Tax=Pleuronectes platessa TaxID=8262 RepID=A0A9N7UF58_PLEPL|nr:unnamed protein product [Pleuronectes platessa]
MSAGNTAATFSHPRDSRYTPKALVDIALHTKVTGGERAQTERNLRYQFAEFCSIDARVPGGFAPECPGAADGRVRRRAPSGNGFHSDPRLNVGSAGVCMSKEQDPDVYFLSVPYAAQLAERAAAHRYCNVLYGLSEFVCRYKKPFVFVTADPSALLAACRLQSPALPIIRSCCPSSLCLCIHLSARLSATKRDKDGKRNGEGVLECGRSRPQGGGGAGEWSCVCGDDASDKHRLDINHTITRN